MNTPSNFPTGQDLQRIERQAHAMRAQVMADMVVALGHALVALPGRVASIMRRVAHI